jgi:hypothetical protein
VGLATKGNSGELKELLSSCAPPGGTCATSSASSTSSAGVSVVMLVLLVQAGGFRQQQVLGRAAGICLGGRRQEEEGSMPASLTQQPQLRFAHASTVDVSQQDMSFEASFCSGSHQIACPGVL